MGDGSDRQSGWYTVGGTLAAAGCALFPVGLTSTPQSKTLQLLGLVAFVGGLAIIFYAMIGRRAVDTRPVVLDQSQPTGQATRDGVSSPQSPNVHGTPPATPAAGKQPGSRRFQLVAVISASLAVIGLGSFFIIGPGHLQDNSVAAGEVVTANTSSYAGPSTQGYAVLGNVSVNTQVRVICTVYGEPASPGAGNALWDYTDHGWLNNQFISTGTVKPIAAGCGGTTSKPSAGVNLPTRSSGPYAVIAQEGSGVPVRAQPSLGSPTIHELAAGTFVWIQCTVSKGPVVPAPRAIGSAGSDNIWDQIVDSSGWVPDSYVATYTKNSVAPSC